MIFTYLLSLAGRLIVRSVYGSTPSNGGSSAMELIQVLIYSAAINFNLKISSINVKLSSPETFKPLLDKVRLATRGRSRHEAAPELQVRTVLFDFDGTLANSLELGYEVMDILCQRHGYECLPKEQYRILGTRQAIKEMGIPLWRLPRLMREGRRLMASRICEVSPVVDIVAAIESLFALNVSLGVVTSNSGNNVQAWLEHHNIDQYFAIILGGGGLLRKERCIRKVMGRHNIKPHELLYVGDESRDIAACHRLKIHCVAVTWGLDLDEKLRLDNPESIINVPSELLPLVRENLHPSLKSL